MIWVEGKNKRAELRHRRIREDRHAGQLAGRLSDCQLQPLAVDTLGELNESRHKFITESLKEMIQERREIDVKPQL